MKSKIQQRRNRRVSRRSALRGGRPLPKAKQEAIQNAMDRSSYMIDQASHFQDGKWQCKWCQGTASFCEKHD